jgi:predicted secreted protein
MHKYAKPIAWLVFFVCTWLAFGASSLHQKDVAAGVRETAPAYHSMQTPLVLGTIALLAVLFAMFAKAGTNAPTRIKL